MITYNDFVAFEENAYKCIKLNPQYVDITGDVLAGLLLSQIVYWNLPSKKNGSKRCGDYLIKKREDWYDEIRLTPRQIDRVMKILIAKGIVDVKVQKSVIYNGTPVHHIRLNIDILVELINKHLNSAVVSTSPNGEISLSTSPNGEISLSTSPNGEVTSPNGEVTSPNGEVTSPNGDSDLTKRGNLLYTEITTEITTENTTEITFTNPNQKGQPGNPTEVVVEGGMATLSVSPPKGGVPPRTLYKEYRADDSIMEQNSIVEPYSFDPLCRTYFGAHYDSARPFFNEMSLSSSSQLIQIINTLSEKYSVDVACDVITALRQKRSNGEIQYYNQTYFFNALEEENEMEKRRGKFKQFCTDYIGAGEDAVEVYNFYVSILKSAIDAKADKSKKGIRLSERRIENVRTLIEKYGRVQFFKVLRHYAQEFKQRTLRYEPSIDSFTRYLDSYVKYTLNKKSQTGATEIQKEIHPVVEQIVVLTPYERTLSIYKKQETEYYNWLFRCTCGATFEPGVTACPQCHATIDQETSMNNFYSLLFTCTCGTGFNKKDKICPACGLNFELEEAIARLQRKLKKDEGKKKDEHGANVQVCRDTGHRSTQQDC